MVALHHFLIVVGHPAVPVLANAYLFVDFFFVLSGFVIGSSYGERLRGGYSFGLFVRRRFARIYPLHLAMLLAMLAVECGFSVLPFDLQDFSPRIPFSGDHSPTALLSSVLLVQIFVGSQGMVWNGPSWSIAAEMWIYLGFVLLLRFPGQWVLRIGAAIAVVSPTLLFYGGNGLNVIHGYEVIVRCAFGFALGLVGWLAMPGMLSMRMTGVVASSLEAVAALGIVAFVGLAGASVFSIFAPYLFLGAILIFACEQGVLSRWLKARPFLLAGTLSYSIYLTHAFLLARFSDGLAGLELFTGFDPLASGDPFALAFAACLFLLIVGICSYFTFRLIEQPFQALIRGDPPPGRRRPLKSIGNRPM